MKNASMELILNFRPRPTFQIFNGIFQFLPDSIKISCWKVWNCFDRVASVDAIENVGQGVFARLIFFWWRVVGSVDDWIFNSIVLIFIRDTEQKFHCFSGRLFRDLLHLVFLDSIRWEWWTYIHENVFYGILAITLSVLFGYPKEFVWDYGGMAPAKLGFWLQNVFFLPVRYIYVPDVEFTSPILCF